MAIPDQPSSKFRPYFTAPELSEIIRCVKASSTNTTLLRYLETFAMKIDRGILEPQLNLAPTLEQKLGMSPSGTPDYNPAELYNIWTKNPEYLTPPQLAIVHQYRWENDKMSADEEIAYSTQIIQSRS
mgnify:CR=1 FL=1